jgi:hypothetical protein
VPIVAAFASKLHTMAKDLWRARRTVTRPAVRLARAVDRARRDPGWDDRGLGRCIELLMRRMPRSKVPVAIGLRARASGRCDQHSQHLPSATAVTSVTRDLRALHADSCVSEPGRDHNVEPRTENGQGNPIGDSPRRKSIG